MNGCIVISGAAGSLGSALAKNLVARGNRVVLLDLPSTTSTLTALASELGSSAFAHTMDVCTPSEWTDALRAIQRAFGTPEGAALVAGGWAGAGPLWSEESDDVWNAMMRRNLETARISLRAMLPILIEQRRGSIVVVGAKAVAHPWTAEGASAYVASKAALVALAQTVAAEALEYGVCINAVLPSVIDTEANRAAMPQAQHAKWVLPESLASVIAFLLSNEARDISGAAIPVYGRS